MLEIGKREERLFADLPVIFGEMKEYYQKVGDGINVCKENGIDNNIINDLSVEIQDIIEVIGSIKIEIDDNGQFRLLEYTCGDIYRLESEIANQKTLTYQLIGMKKKLIGELEKFSKFKGVGYQKFTKQIDKRINDYIFDRDIEDNNE